MIRLHRITLVVILLGLGLLMLTGKGTWAAPERDVAAQTVPTRTPSPESTNTPDPPTATATSRPTITSEPVSTLTPSPTTEDVSSLPATSATPSSLPQAGQGSDLAIWGGLFLLGAGASLWLAGGFSRRLGLPPRHE